MALTAVPVLGVLLRGGDFSDDARSGADRDTWLQRLYTPILTWVLGHKAITVFGAVLIVGSSLVLCSCGALMGNHLSRGGKRFFGEPYPCPFSFSLIPIVGTLFSLIPIVGTLLYPLFLVPLSALQHIRLKNITSRIAIRWS